MSSLTKCLTLVLVTLFLASLLVTMHSNVKAEEQTVQIFNGNPTLPDMTFKLNITNPSNKTVYVGIMPLNLTIDCIADCPVFWGGGGIYYTIDNSSETLLSNMGFEFVNTTVVNTSINGIVNVSNLTDGSHKLTITFEGMYNIDNDFIFTYNSSAAPIHFSVNNSPVTIKPFPTATALAIALAIIVTVSIIVLLYRKKYKANISTNTPKLDLSG